ncbi:potassium channel protein [Thermococci archaeon]|nr:MAG: potassium channel protein [Thermococci archaeon]RLF96689.1 MAG: potassium channel protein [Thermococci archaeon]RLG01746.1 MAG: potassium channel protein [Thermococci archaeon]HEC88349.1 potassium channel protein [Thermoplasmata archaeon]
MNGEIDLWGIKDILVGIKDTSELMIDLAYTSLLYCNEEIAGEVFDLEKKMDKLNYKLKLITLRAARTEEAEKLIAIIEIANAAELIADAALKIAENVFREKIHPIFVDAMKEADEIIIKETVNRNSKMINKTVRELKIKTNTGMHIFLVKRGNDYIYRLDNFKFKENDIIFAEGPEDGKKEIEELLGMSEA